MNCNIRNQTIGIGFEFSLKEGEILGIQGPAETGKSILI